MRAPVGRVGRRQKKWPTLEMLGSHLGAPPILFLEFKDQL